MVKAAVVLSGCGYLDGAEVRESVLSLLYLDQQGVQASCFAPDVDQHHSVNHLSQSEEVAPRNVLAEAARIARGEVLPLSELAVDGFDMLVIPGGFGVAKNLSDFAFKGAKCSVLPDFKRVIEGFYAQEKPIGAICIAPAVLAAALPDKGFQLTIGEDADAASAIEKLGHTHVVCSSREAVIDEPNRIATCSAYMREDAISAVAAGIEHVISALLRMHSFNLQTKAI